MKPTGPIGATGASRAGVPGGKEIRWEVMDATRSRFFDRPILNSPYEYPSRHWELDGAGHPTGEVLDHRREVSFVTPIPRPAKDRGQARMVFDERARTLEGDGQEYDLVAVINDVRREVDAWRAIPDPSRWRVTPETARLLQHWRSFRFSGIRPFFCQIEAAETAIWLTEVAPALGRQGSRFRDHLAAANGEANSGLPRLRVLQPNDPDSYYRSRELVPADLMAHLDRAKIVIANYHAFMRRDALEVSRGGRALLRGRGPDIASRETDGQMLQRVMPELMGSRNVMVLNDEAHHCYREKRTGTDEEGPLQAEERAEAARNEEAARVWMSGLDTVERKLGIGRIVDLSATPFFLRGSGYAEGTLFPWTMSDFSLMDAIEIRFPRVSGYRVELPEERVSATFDANSTLELTPETVGPCETRNEGIVGEGIDLRLEHLGDVRMNSVVFHLTRRLLETKWRDPGEDPKLHLFGELKRIVRQWIDGHLVCTGGTRPAQLLYESLADTACERITRGIVLQHLGDRPVRAVLDPYNPVGSTMEVNFTTSKRSWRTAEDLCHVNWAICDSEWEAQFCRIAEAHPRVRAYVKNQGLGFGVPYRYRTESRIYVPDFIVVVDDGRGNADLLRLVVEIKGYRREDAKEKHDTMRSYWVPGVNVLGCYGRWDFAEFGDIRTMEADFAAKAGKAFESLIDGFVPAGAPA